MLVLSRKAEERIQIGDDVEVVIIKTTNEKVRIGIIAPESTRVLRTELAQQEPAAV